MDTPGILLRGEERNSLTISLINQGELAISSNTNELVVNEFNSMKYRPVIIPDNKGIILKGLGQPSIGDDNFPKLRLRESIEDIKMDFKINVGTWKQRNEGYTESYMETNFEDKVSFPTDLIKRDGSVKFSTGHDMSDPQSIVSKQYITDRSSEFTDHLERFIRKDGSNQMDTTYSPKNDFDVLILAHLTGGDYVLVPPTSVENKIENNGIIWNNSGAPSVFQYMPFNEYVKLDIVEQSWNNYLEFGAVSVDGETIVIGFKNARQFKIADLDGAILNTIYAPQFDYDFGKVTSIKNGKILIQSSSKFFLYDIDGSLLMTLTAPVGDAFGYPQFLTEDRIYLASRSTSTNKVVYVYDLLGNLVKSFETPTKGTVDSIYVFEDTILIGESHSGTQGEGKVFEFDLSGVFRKEIIAPVIGNDFSFGFRVIMNRKYMVITSLNRDVGYVHLYSREGEFITEVMGTNGSTHSNDYFGANLGLDDDFFLVSAFRNAYDNGSISIYNFHGQLVKTLQHPLGRTGAYFGNSIALNRGNLVIGCVKADIWIYKE